MNKVSDSRNTIAIVLAVLAVGLSATGAWFYISLKKENTSQNQDSYKYKQSQIDECMKSGTTFTDQPTLEANYQKKVDYCTQLNK